MSQSLSISVVSQRNDKGQPTGFLSFPIGIPTGFSGGGTVPIPLPISQGGTNSTTPLINGKLIVSQGGSIVEGTDSSAPTFQQLTLTTLLGEGANNYLDDLIYIDASGLLRKGSNYDALVQSRNNIEGSVMTFDGNKMGQSALIQTNGVANTITLGNSTTIIQVPGKISVHDVDIITSLVVTGSFLSNNSNILGNTTLNGNTDLTGSVSLTGIPSVSAYLPTDRNVYIDTSGSLKSAPNMDSTVQSRPTDEGQFLTYGSTTNEISRSSLISSTFPDITLGNASSNINISGMLHSTDIANSSSIVTKTLTAVLSSSLGNASANTLTLLGIPNTITANVLYFDPITKLVTYGAKPSGTIVINPGENFIATTDGTDVFKSAVLKTTATSVDILGVASLNVGGLLSANGGLFVTSGFSADSGTINNGLAILGGGLAVSGGTNLFGETKTFNSGTSFQQNILDDGSGNVLLSGAVKLANISLLNKPHVLFYDSITGDISYDVPPPASISITSGEGAVSTTDGTNLFKSSILLTTPTEVSVVGILQSIDPLTLSIRNILDDGFGNAIIAGKITANANIVSNNGLISNTLQVSSVSEFSGIVFAYNSLLVSNGLNTDNLVVSNNATIGNGLAITGGGLSVSGSVNLLNVPNTNTPYILFYDNTTGLVTYDVPPPASIYITPGEGAVSTTDGTYIFKSNVLLTTSTEVSAVGILQTINPSTFAIQNILDDTNGNAQIAGSLYVASLNVSLSGNFTGPVSTSNGLYASNGIISDTLLISNNASINNGLVINNGGLFVTGNTYTTGSIATAQNSLDDGSGNVTIAGTIKNIGMQPASTNLILFYDSTTGLITYNVPPPAVLSITPGEGSVSTTDGTNIFQSATLITSPNGVSVVGTLQTFSTGLALQNTLDDGLGNGSILGSFIVNNGITVGSGGLAVAGTTTIIGILETINPGTLLPQNILDDGSGNMTIAGSVKFLSMPSLSTPYVLFFDNTTGAVSYNVLPTPPPPVISITPGEGFMTATDGTNLFSSSVLFTSAGSAHVIGSLKTCDIGLNDRNILDDGSGNAVFAGLLSANFGLSVSGLIQADNLDLTNIINVLGTGSYIKDLTADTLLINLTSAFNGVVTANAGIVIPSGGLAVSGGTSVFGVLETYNAGTLNLQNTLDDGSGNVILRNNLSLTNIPNTATSQVLFFDSSTGLVTYGSAPSGTLIINAGEDFIATTDGTNVFKSAVLKTTATGVQVLGTNTLTVGGTSTLTGLVTASNGLKVNGLTNTATSQVLYYNSGTGTITYGAPSAISIVSGENFTATTDGTSIFKSAVLKTNNTGAQILGTLSASGTSTLSGLVTASNGITVTAGGIAVQGGASIFGSTITYNSTSLVQQNTLDDGSSNAIIKGAFNASFVSSSTQTFTTVGITQITPPAGATSMTIKLWGAGGQSGSATSIAINNSYGGGGGFSSVTVIINPLSTYWMVIGNPGASTVIGSGGNGQGSASTITRGGGASAVFQLTGSTYLPLAVAGGGGGGGWGFNSGANNYAGGNGACGGNGQAGNGAVSFSPLVTRNQGGFSGSAGAGGAGGSSGVPTSPNTDSNVGNPGDAMTGVITSLSAPVAGSTGYGGVGGAVGAGGYGGSGAGGGYGGGGGGQSIYSAGGSMAGGGGGGSFGTTLLVGALNVPGGSTDPNYVSPKGQGGAPISGVGIVTGNLGQAGLGVIIFNNYALTTSTTGASTFGSAVNATYGVRMGNYMYYQNSANIIITNGSTLAPTWDTPVLTGQNVTKVGNTFVTGVPGWYDVEMDIFTTAVISAQEFSLYFTSSADGVHHGRQAYGNGRYFTCKAKIPCLTAGVVITPQIFNNTGSAVTTSGNINFNYIKIALSSGL